MKGIEKMTALIRSEAEADREARISKANTEAEAVLADYQNKAQELVNAEADKTAKEVAAIIERATASSHQVERNRLLEARGAVLDRAYEEALNKLCSDEYASKADYLSMLEAIFDSVLAEELEAEKRAIDNDLYGEYQAPECYTLRLSVRDSAIIGAKLVDYAKKAASKAGKTVMLDEKAAHIKGGLILICGDIELNASLELYMNKIRNATEGEVCGILFG